MIDTLGLRFEPLTWNPSSAVTYGEEPGVGPGPVDGLVVRGGAGGGGQAGWGEGGVDAGVVPVHRAAAAVAVAIAVAHQRQAGWGGGSPLAENKGQSSTYAFGA